MEDLYYFSSIMKHGQLKAAALHLKVSVPTLSRSIRRLEKKLNQRLFNRTSNCLKPTPEAIHLHQGVYESKYGRVPEFSASFHCGKVVVGEVGEVKSQISYFGNVLYETAELEKMCGMFKVELLISEQLLKETNIPKHLITAKEGEFNTAFGSKIECYSVSEAS